jgi:hypothetical protein
VSVVTGRARARWAAVAAGVAVLCGIPALVAALPVAGSTLTAAHLHARIMASAKVAYQGYAQSDVSLALPALPDLSDVTSLLDGSTDQYAWYRSPGAWRADVLTAAGEDDTYQTGNGTFTWQYGRDLLTQVVGSAPVRLPRAADLLPPALGRRLLAYAGSAARQYRLPSQRVAGVDAAGLRLVPAGGATTIGAVDIWADPATGLPVQAEIFARGRAEPVLVSRFLDLSITAPPAATVTPVLAPGADFSTTELPDVAGVLNGFGPPLPASLAGYRRAPSPGGLADVAAYGTGFARFAVLPLPRSTGMSAMTAASSAGAAISMPGGSAVLLLTPLLTVLLASPPGGPVYLLTGTVTAGPLERAAAELLDAQ